MIDERIFFEKANFQRLKHVSGNEVAVINILLLQAFIHRKAESLEVVGQLMKLNEPFVVRQSFCRRNLWRDGKLYDFCMLAQRAAQFLQFSALALFAQEGDSRANDPVLRELARIVRGADFKDEITLTPESAGLRTISEGFPLIAADDHETVERASFLYDALYASLAERIARRLGAKR